MVTVDPAYPDAWRREPYYSQLKAIARSGTIKIRVGRRFIKLMPDGTEKESAHSREHIEGVRADEVEQ
jgi:hypothetical protein